MFYILAVKIQIDKSKQNCTPHYLTLSIILISNCSITFLLIYQSEGTNDLKWYIWAYVKDCLQNKFQASQKAAQTLEDKALFCIGSHVACSISITLPETFHIFYLLLIIFLFTWVKPLLHRGDCPIKLGWLFFSLDLILNFIANESNGCNKYENKIIPCPIAYYLCLHKSRGVY